MSYSFLCCVFIDYSRLLRHPTSFKRIQIVPSGDDMIDICLSRTQRKTPTVVHKGYAITRIRSFYMRKVKYCQQTFHDKLTQIVEDFPMLNDIHPFYADLINVLYDRDHYKLALGQVNHARSVVSNIAKDYVRLLKYGDSLYRCKQLKRAAMGRMCSMVKKLKASLGYLEHVRQHLSRLPSIDTSALSLIVCGFPNVGKSSFMNKVTRADVDVQPYPFTTKSIFVGHLDYKYVRFQVLDTPGILDRPLEERNTIEMVGITALAHLHAAVMFFVDISEQCGHSVADQLKLFDSITPLFANKPLLVVQTKIDVQPLETLSAESRALLEQVAQRGTGLAALSSVSEEGVIDTRNKICDILLADRAERRIQGGHVHSIANRLQVSVPQQRDSKARPPVIPASVLARRAAQAQGVTPMDTSTNADPEDYPRARTLRDHNVDMRKRYLLKNEDWKFDVMPQLVDGKNVFDYIDPEVDKRLAELEAEEDELQRQHEQAMEEDDLDIDEEDMQLIERWNKERDSAMSSHRLKRSLNGSQVISRKRKIGQNASDMRESLAELGFQEQASRIIRRERSKSKNRGRSRAARGEAPKQRRDHSLSSGRSIARARSMGGNKVMEEAAQKISYNTQRKRNRTAHKGDADRHIPDLKPKHLNSGKKGFSHTRR